MYLGCIELRHLNIIKWKDENGEVQQFNLKDKISHKWRTIGNLLGLTSSKLQSLDDEYRDPFECCRAVLDDWFFSPPMNYPAKWKGLIKLLEDSTLDEVATELRTVLSNAVDLQ